MHSINNTYIDLIPKVNSPNNVNEFRPISLYNIMCKLVTQTLANSLEKILPFIISINQSVFLPRRLITNNIIVAYEVSHSMKTMNK